MIVFDLDGTLADTSHREHFVRRPVGEKDWEGFHAAAVGDTAKVWVVATYLALKADGHYIEIWTGRDEKYRDETIKWLASRGITIPVLRMRLTGDKTPDHVMKSAWADAHEMSVNLVFEDRQRVVDMWRARGVTCCQVAPGDF